jgi:D-sedoheptulose 7-phosphate isomerase|tara:strand:- start:138 stop:722 length:585 start_codon:yes stop_codon:yes gene_type:complete
MSNYENDILNIFEKSATVINESKASIKEINSAVNMIIKTIEKGKKIVIFGNGGSAADAQHMAAEFVGRYLIERDSLPAIALTTDTSALTGIGNDYGFEKVFARQCDALVNNGDLVIAISTSGKSPNIIEGIKTSKNKNAKIILLTGKNNNKLKHLTDITIRVPSNETPRIQESHRIIIHIICEFVEKHFLKSTK